MQYRAQAELAVVSRVSFFNSRRLSAVTLPTLGSLKAGCFVQSTEVVVVLVAAVDVGTDGFTAAMANVLLVVLSAARMEVAGVAVSVFAIAFVVVSPAVAVGAVEATLLVAL